MIIVGARPQFIKSAPVIRECLRTKQVDLQLINSGQHYDYELSQIFFNQLGLPKPVLNLQVGSGSHSSQTGRAMIRIERCILELRPEIVLVPGDTNTTLAAGLASAKLNLPVGHIEAGARSYDMSMPEEVNRIVTDHVSTMLFAPTKITERNLRSEGIARNRIFRVGDTMLDGLKTAIPLAKKQKPSLLGRMNLTAGEYVLMTAHRPANVDVQERLENIVNAILRISKSLKAVFPMHPRVAYRLKSYGLHRKLKLSRNVILTKPLDYIKMIALLDSAYALLTDSGGLQKEAFLLGTPCVTMRGTTEWPETLKSGANTLVGVDSDRIVRSILRSEKRHESIWDSKKTGNPFGSGRASEYIVRTVLSKTAQLSNET